jgi:RNA polymerase sigma-70 factor (ECF subfamily)
MGAESAPETVLIRSAASGNTSAFAELVRLYRFRVLRTAAGILGSSDEAEDVAQQVFIKLWQHLGDYDPTGSFASWIYRITVNLAIDALRRRKHETLLSDDQPAGQVDAEGQVLARGQRDAVRRAIAKLPDKTRAALVLREYEQLSYKEIAEALKIPLGTVMSRLNYARRTLAKLLESERAEKGAPSQAL